MQLKNSRIYLFSSRRCSQIQSAHPWELKKDQKKEVMLENAQNTAHVYFKKEIALISYPQGNAYFWTVSVGVISLHLPLNCQNKELFEFKMQQEDVKIIQWSEVSQSMRKDVELHCGDNIATKCNVEKGKVERIGCKIGSFFGSISKKFIGELPNHNIQKQKVTSQEKQSASQTENKSQIKRENWSKMAEQVKTLNETITKKFQPAREIVSSKVDKLGEKFNKSQNKVIKSIRNFGLQLKHSLNEGYNASTSKPTHIQTPIQTPAENDKPIESQRVLNSQKQ